MEHGRPCMSMELLENERKNEMKRHAKHSESITYGDVMVHMRFEVYALTYNCYCDAYSAYSVLSSGR